MDTVTITNLQRFSLDDGPGIRTTVFFKGCGLKCHWCHNPECISPAPELLFFRHLCDACGACAARCPVHAHDFSQGVHRFDRKKCRACGACAQACPNGALNRLGRTIPLPELAALLLEDSPFFSVSHGGVTFSGGEPVLQAEALCCLLKEMRAKGIHTAVDTSGYAPRAGFESIAGETDLFLFDLKFASSPAHQAYTGKSNEQILSNLKFLEEEGCRIWIRIPVVPPYTTAPDLRERAEFLSAFRHIDRVELLKYHRYGENKYEALDLPSRHFSVPDGDAMEAYAQIFRSFGLPVVYT